MKSLLYLFCLIFSLIFQNQIINAQCLTPHTPTTEEVGHSFVSATWQHATQGCQQNLGYEKRWREAGGNWNNEYDLGGSYPGFDFRGFCGCFITLEFPPPHTNISLNQLKPCTSYELQIRWIDFEYDNNSNLTILETGNWTPTYSVATTDCQNEYFSTNCYNSPSYPPCAQMTSLFMDDNLVTDFPYGDEDCYTYFEDMGYSHYPNVDVTLTRGIDHLWGYSVTNSVFANELEDTYDFRVKIWADFNQDGNFDEVNELLVNHTNTTLAAASTYFSTDLSIPVDAVIGETTLRMIFVQEEFSGDIADPAPCESFSSGYVKDFTVQVVEGASIDCPTNPDEILCLDWLFPQIEDLSCLDCPFGSGFGVTNQVYQANLDGQTGIVIRTQCDLNFLHRRFYSCDGELIHDCFEANLQVCNDWNDDIEIGELVWDCSQSLPNCSNNNNDDILCLDWVVDLWNNDLLGYFSSSDIFIFYNEDEESVIFADRINLFNDEWEIYFFDIDGFEQNYCYYNTNPNFICDSYWSSVFENAEQLWVWEQGSLIDCQNDCIIEFPIGYDMNLSQFNLGRTVSIDGNLAAAGTYQYAVSGEGAVHIYEKDNANWNRIHILKSTNPVDGDGFGHKVYLNSDMLVVQQNPDPNSSANDKIFILENIVNSWEVVHEIPYGASIDILSKDLLTCTFDDFVYLHEENNDSWTSSLIFSNPETYQNGFGSEVGLQNDFMVIAAMWDNDIADKSGAIYVLEKPNGIWEVVQKIKASDAASDDAFGRSLETSNDKIFVPAWFNDEAENNAGAVYVFEKLNGVWQETQKILPPFVQNNLRFGMELTYDNGILAIGCDNPHSNNEESSVFLFEENDNGQFTLSQEILPTSEFIATSPAFGSDISINGDNLIIGHPMADYDAFGPGAGFLFIYDLDCEDSTYCPTDPNEVLCLNWLQDTINLYQNNYPNSCISVDYLSSVCEINIGVDGIYWLNTGTLNMEGDNLDYCNLSTDFETIWDCAMPLPDCLSISCSLDPEPIWLTGTTDQLLTNSTFCDSNPGASYTVVQSHIQVDGIDVISILVPEGTYFYDCDGNQICDNNNCPQEYLDALNNPISQLIFDYICDDVVTPPAPCGDSTFANLQFILNPVIATSGSTIQIPVTVQNFGDSIQLFLHTLTIEDGSVFEPTAILNGALNISNSSIIDNEIVISWENATQPALADDTVIFYIEGTITGNAGNCTTIDFTDNLSGDIIVYAINSSSMLEEVEAGYTASNVCAVDATTGLSCSTPLEILCPSITPGNNENGTSNFDLYSCSDYFMNGNEAVHSVNIAGPQDVIFTLEGLTEDLELIILDACNPESCIAYSFRSNNSVESIIVEDLDGEYFVIVDGYLEASSGYILSLDCPDTGDLPSGQLDCTNTLELGCDETIMGSTCDGANNVISYCAGSQSDYESGQEVVYSFNLTESRWLIFTLSDFTEDLDMFLVSPCNPDDCIFAFNNSGLTEETHQLFLGADDYFLVIDGFNGAESSFQLSTSCGTPGGGPVQDFNCDGAQMIGCENSPIMGNNGNGSNNVSSHCGTFNTGPELIYEFTLDNQNTVEFILSEMTQDLNMFIYSDCTVDSECIASSTKNDLSEEGIKLLDMEASSYFLVIDGYNGAISDFVLTLNCEPMEVMKSGEIYTETMLPIPDTEVTCNDDVAAIETMTDENGFYEFEPVMGGQDYTVSPKRDGNDKDGVNFIDNSFLVLYIQNSSAITFTNYQKIAADVNGDGCIASDDVLILTDVADPSPNSSNEFSLVDSWRFVPAAFDLEDSPTNCSNPFISIPKFQVPAFEESISLPNLVQDRDDLNFIGVKMGDLNADWEPGAPQIVNGFDTSDAVIFNLPAVSFMEGEEKEIMLTTSSFESLLALEITLQYAATDLEITDISSSFPDGTLKLGQYSSSDNSSIMNTYWSWITGNNLSSNLAEMPDVLKLTIRAKKELTNIQNHLWAKPNGKDGTAILSDLSDKPIWIGKELLNDTKDKQRLDTRINIYPNPFSTTSTMQFTLTEKASFTLNIYNVLGELITEKTIDGHVGINRIMLDANDFSETGMYYIALKNEHQMLHTTVLFQ